MAKTPLIITGVQLALLKATSTPKKLNVSELFMACIPKNIVPANPIKSKIIPNAFIITYLMFGLTKGKIVPRT